MSSPMAPSMVDEPGKNSKPLAPIQLQFCAGGIVVPPINSIELNESNRSQLIAAATAADKSLGVPHRLPSLHVLADAVFRSCPAQFLKQWADAMVVPTGTSVAKLLARLPQPAAAGRPCGYVFKRGDIAWNCRQCQQDPTCVICDGCFQASDHKGHEVYFHRTAPGGCCDCGDAEAWDAAGCCAQHRPVVSQQSGGVVDPMEAVRALDDPPQESSVPFRDALQTIVTAAVYAITVAVEGTGRAADASRLDAGEGARYQLRLHNDDVHTFDEVIQALQQLGVKDPTGQTRQVDSDGQVVVLVDQDHESVLNAFQLLKQKGLACAAVTPSQVDAEHRAQALCAWLTEIGTSHPEAAYCIVKAFEGPATSARFIPPYGNLDWFPKKEESSYLTVEEHYELYRLGEGLFGKKFTDTISLPPQKPPVQFGPPKSPHALWGTIPSQYAELSPNHPFLNRFRSDPGQTTQQNELTGQLYVVDTDIRKQQEGELLASSPYPQDAIPGLHVLAPGGSPMQYRHLLQVASFRAPLTPLLWLLLLDPYPTKQLRQALHAIYLSMLTNPRFKARFAGALSVAYRPLTTLFCAGVGTEADTPLQFTVQIFTAGSLVRALQHGPAVEALLRPQNVVSTNSATEIGCFVPPIAHCIARCVHTNILGSTKEVSMALKHNAAAASLVFQAGEHPVYTLLAAAPDDEFLDARSTRHKRLPALLRDLDYVMDTPHTATALLANTQFVAAWCRLLRLAQGMDPQKRRISGGHVEYETNRWLEAFALSLSLSRDAVAENCSDKTAVGNGMAGLLREMKLWLYREGVLQTGLPVGDRDQGAKLEALQSSTLHIGTDALGCATGVKMTENQLSIIENSPKKPIDWLRIPHSPMGGNALSFHLPLHRALAKCVKSICALTPDLNDPDWWKIPVLDEVVSDPGVNPLVPILRPTLRPPNCRVVWSAGPDCTSPEAQRRRTRSRAAATNIAAAKIIYSLADHPARCLAAALQIERHLWARNGNSVAAMAMNYSSAPLSRSFRDLDLLMVQLSSTGMNCGLGANRIFSLLLSRFGMDGYLVDPERKAGKWVNPPRQQDPEHATILAECFFTMLCVLVTEVPSPAEEALQRNVRRELLHALAAEPRTHSEASQAASCAISRKEESEGSFREIFTETLREIGKQKSAPGRGSSGPPVFELNPQVCDEYDPAFFHIRRHEHQHAMDVIARLRKHKLGDKRDTHCLPLVCAPPKAHLRFLPCRLVLHLSATNAAIRRVLLFALTNGSWLPPAEPQEQAPPSQIVLTTSTITATNSADVPMTSVRYRTARSPGRRPGEKHDGPVFSSEVVASSSVSFLEVLQLLTLQVHTLEECASLHRLLPDMDEDGCALSATLSINTYLQRLIHVPDSLTDVWALQPYPAGPLRSSGSGENKGSILGLLIALYEHRADHGAKEDDEDYGPGDEGHGGARALVSSGVKWLLRFVYALNDGALSVGAAVNSATTGIPISKSKDVVPTWTISEDARLAISGMLKNVPDLWPKARSLTASPGKINPRGKEAMKAKQKRVMEMMRAKQEAFAASMGPFDDEAESKKSTEEEDTCIICRCDDSDVEHNGPLGYLGHVQRSRMSQLRASQDMGRDEGKPSIRNTYRVVGHMGCQLREAEAMDSSPLTCLPKGSVVTAIRTKIADHHDILSRRILVQHVSKDTQTGSNVVTEGWASVQSSQGYVIMSPLETLCYSSTRWGTTRPVIKQCGHAAHLKCVATHTSSLRMRADGEQPYDGRFAANIHDGEFLCPLCKQLSNVLIPRARGYKVASPLDSASSHANAGSHTTMGSLRRKLSSSKPTLSDRLPMEKKAFEEFGSQLYDAMNVPWDRAVGEQKKRQEKWHKSILSWDFESPPASPVEGTRVGSALRILRQQLIAWGSVGHSAAALEAGARGVEEVLPFGVLSETSDPWPEYSVDSMDSHPMLLDLKRTMTGVSGLYELLKSSMVQHFANDPNIEHSSCIVGSLLSDILDGRSWVEPFAAKKNERVAMLWSELSSFMSAIPCHVSRDGTIPQRCEARATAAAMWVCLAGTEKDSAPARNHPPAPLAIQQLFVENNRQSETSGDWGTECLDDIKNATSSPFRPTIASGFLHLPLIVWDLHTFAGAVFTSLLSVDNSALPSMDELLHLAHRLLVARMVQVIVAPGGLEICDDMDLDEDDVWNTIEKTDQGRAIVRLVSHCRSIVGNGLIESPASLLVDDAAAEALPANASVLAAVGSAILPFARALVLILRACTAVIRERRNDKPPEGMEVTVTNAICHNEIMSAEDAFKIVKDLLGPLPSDLIQGSWLQLINRWVVASVVLEMHHGSTGRSLQNPGLSSASHPANVASQQNAHGGAEMLLDRSQRGNPKAVLSDDSTDGMEVELDGIENVHRPVLAVPNEGGFILVNEDGDQDSGDSMDEAEEMVTFGVAEEQQMEGDADDGDESMGNEESSEDGSSIVVGLDDEHASDSKFANLGRSPILPFQPSFLGVVGVGPGRHNSMFDFVMANKVMVDLSHLGATHRREKPSFTLIRLPKSFVELYNIVNKVKGRDESSGMDDEDGGTAETAICLLTGAVMRSGASRPVYSRSNRPPGACTLHGRKTASGIGIFFLVQKCTVLLMHNNKSAYSPSLYVDEHGEEDPQLKRGKPLFLNEARYRALELLWRQQGIPREVAQIRSTSDRVIRDNWY